jgi:UDP-N-acetyl-D-glucosamine/UDP-N-acetyl-D-galactosamine dehydrogenase
MRKITNIAVIGLGYVGAPLALELAKHFSVCGYDIDAERVTALQAGRDHTGELHRDELLESGWTLTSDAQVAISAADVVIVTVPTPITDANVPDLGPVKAATRTLAQYLAAGATVIYESTVYPGVTEDVCVPIIEQAEHAAHVGHEGEIRKRKHGCDFWVAYSPERINPGDKVHTLTNTTKIVSGDTPETLELVDFLYSKITTTFRSGSIKIAEAAKVIENTQRDVNIALMNELSQIFSRLEIDTHDVIEAAASKWNFQRFVPGFVGGHCISVDPYYLTHRSAQVGYIPSLILAAREVNDKMPSLVAEKTLKALRRRGLPHDALVTVLGITFKEDVPDIRNSKAVDLVRELISWGINVQVIDPVAASDEVQHEYGIALTPVEEQRPAAAVVLAVAHQIFVDEGWSGVRRYLQPGLPTILTDVKGALPRESVPANVTLVRV